MRSFFSTTPSNIHLGTFSTVSEENSIYQLRGWLRFEKLLLWGEIQEWRFQRESKIPIGWHPYLEVEHILPLHFPQSERYRVEICNFGTEFSLACFRKKVFYNLTAFERWLFCLCTMRDPAGLKTKLLQWNIDDTLRRIDSLLSITTADNSDIRLTMDLEPMAHVPPDPLLKRARNRTCSNSMASPCMRYRSQVYTLH